jgi:hypothetical protein
MHTGQNILLFCPKYVYRWGPFTRRGRWDRLHSYFLTWWQAPPEARFASRSLRIVASPNRNSKTPVAEGPRASGRRPSWQWGAPGMIYLTQLIMKINTLLQLLMRTCTRCLTWRYVTQIFNIHSYYFVQFYSLKILSHFFFNFTVTFLCCFRWGPPCIRMYAWNTIRY